MINFAIIGAGNIAGKFAHAVSLLPEKCRIVSLFARNLEKGKVFAEKYGIGKYFDKLEMVLDDPEVDAVYISLPHAFHHDAAMAAFSRGKGVLCEKSICSNAGELEELIAEAGKRKLFLMEAMWTRFLPVNQKVKEWIDAGKIGRVNSIFAGFCFNAPFNPASRLYDPACAGGALLDVGIYPIAYAQYLLGEPEKFSGWMRPAENGVDGFDLMRFDYSGGAEGVLSCAVCCRGELAAHIYGDRGEITVPVFHNAERAFLQAEGQAPEKFEQLHPEDNGFVYEIIEACRCLESGEIQSRIMPLSDSLANLKIMDQLRQSWNLRYPFEK